MLGSCDPDITNHCMCCACCLFITSIICHYISYITAIQLSLIILDRFIYIYMLSGGSYIYMTNPEVVDTCIGKMKLNGLRSRNHMINCHSGLPLD